uniref:Uncharacterized protein n=1 Tax=Aegilops tauschii subsp. strangulata TaxID=200361 RepID=A0A453BFS2_AEGTS
EAAHGLLFPLTLFCPSHQDSVSNRYTSPLVPASPNPNHAVRSTPRGERSDMPATPTIIGALLGLGTQMYSNALRKLPY